MSLRIFVLAFFLAACGDDPAADGCARDEDCPGGACVASVCIGFRAPDAPPADLAVVDSSTVD